MTVKPLNWEDHSEDQNRFLHDRVVVGPALVDVFGFPGDDEFWVEFLLTEKFKTRNFDFAKQDAQEFIRKALREALAALTEWESDGNESL